MNALIIETAFLGDAIISLSLARALKQMEPSVSIAYLVRAGIEDVIAASPDVDRVIPFDKRGEERGIAGIRQKANALNAFAFDTLLLLHSSRRSQALVTMLNCNTKIGFASMQNAGLTHVIEDTGWSNRYERAILPLRAINRRIELSQLPRIVPPAVPELDPFFSRWNVTVALAPGSAWETKQWGNEKFVQLAHLLTSRNIGVLIIGGASERELAIRIRDECSNGSVLDLAGTVNFLTSVAAIQHASLLVANDSAPVHAAVAVGTKVLAIYGPTVPAFGFAPPDGCGETMELADLWCRPCTPHGSRECPIHTHACMNDIAASDVMDRIGTML